MQYTLKTQNLNLSNEQKRLAKELAISERFFSLLLGRGMKESEMRDFLNPSLKNMASPFDIDNMDVAVKRVKEAISKKQRILIYGDYDCDGICAISILMLHLRDKVDVTYFIPDRKKDGYGVSIDALKGIFSRRKFDLMITVDCGITAVAEVEFLRGLGVDVIVTDHHEPQEVLPNCIVVDAKVNKKGFYDLCGAGVALKLVEALSSREEASKYFDICAIATIADVVPLKEDNRIIAYWGLKQIAKAPRKGIKMLLEEERVSSHDVMFRLAPRMNAAGRLNSAMKVVGLFLETDHFMLKSLTEELARDNTERQALCEQCVEEAQQMLKDVDFNSVGIITLYSEGWNAGVLGIAAARLVEEFKRPTVLFAKDGEDLKGSARSIASINIFELLNSLSHHFTAFGGHAQAAGVSMKKESFDAFKQEANDYLLSVYKQDDFNLPISCEMQLDMGMDFLAFADELERLEPTGYANPRPNFLISSSNLKFERIGMSQHVKCVQNGISLMGFSKYANSLYARTGEVDFEITLGVNVFQNNVSAQGIIQSVGAKDVSIDKEESDVLNLHHFKHSGSVELESVDVSQVEQWLKKPFGTAIVCFSKEEYNAIVASSDLFIDLPVVIATPKCLNPQNCIIVCPDQGVEYGFFNHVVIAGKPLCEGYKKWVSEQAKHAVALGDCTAQTLTFTDDTLRNLYKEMALVVSKSPRVGSVKKFYQSVCSRFKTSEAVFLLAIEIFEELGLLSIGDRGIVTINKKSVTLTNSRVYVNAKGV